MWNMENMKNENKYMGNKGIMWNLGKKKGKKWKNGIKKYGKENKKKWENKGKGKWMWTWKGIRKNG